MLHPYIKYWRKSKRDFVRSAGTIKSLQYPLFFNIILFALYRI